MPTGLEALRNAYTLESAGMGDQIPAEVRGHMDTLRTAGILPPPGQSVPDNIFGQADRAVNLSKVEQYANELHVDPALARAVAEQESHGNAAAISNKGARGVMQVMPDTSKELEPKFGPDPIRQGVGYLGQHLTTFASAPDPQRFALAAYNAGPTNLANARTKAQKRGLDPNNFDNVARFLPEETRNYVPGVLARVQVGQSPQPAAPPAPESTLSRVLGPSTASAEEAPGGTPVPAPPQSGPDSFLRGMAPTAAQVATTLLGRALPGGRVLGPLLGIGAAGLTNALLPGKGDTAGRAVQGLGEGAINEVGGQALSGLGRLAARAIPAFAGPVAKAAESTLAPAAVKSAEELALPATSGAANTMWGKSFVALKDAGWGSKEAFVKDVAGNPGAFVEKFGKLDPAKAAEVFGPEGAQAMGQLSTALQATAATAAKPAATMRDVLGLASSALSGHWKAGVVGEGALIGKRVVQQQYAKRLLSSPAGVQWLASAVDAANNGTLNASADALGQGLAGLATQGLLGAMNPAPPQPALPPRSASPSAAP